MATQQQGLGFYFSKSKKGKCHGKITHGHALEEGAKEQRPTGTDGWTDGQTRVPLPLAEQVKEIAGGEGY